MATNPREEDEPAGVGAWGRRRGSKPDSRSLYCVGDIWTKRCSPVTRAPTPASENSYYTVKYLGITNGELGILSQRKQFLSPNSAFRSPLSSRPGTQPHPPAKDSDYSPLLPSERVYGEYLRPNPGKYDEFMVHQYSRPRGLNTVRKSRKQGMAIAKEVLRVGRRKRSETGSPPAKCAQLERRGVSGRKLCRPKSHSGISKLRLYCRRQTTPVSPSPHFLLIDETYIHRLLLTPADMGKLK